MDTCPGVSSTTPDKQCTHSLGVSTVTIFKMSVIYISSILLKQTESYLNFQPGHHRKPSETTFNSDAKLKLQRERKACFSRVVVCDFMFA